MKFLELFSGTGVLTAEMKRRGHETLSVDISLDSPADIHADVYEFPYEMFEEFDVIWVGLPCTTYSVASAKHRRGTVPLTPEAAEADRNNAELMSKLNSISTTYITENPRGRLRSMPFMPDERDRITVDYCMFGCPVRKSTDLFFQGIQPPETAPRCDHVRGTHAKYSVAWNKYWSWTSPADRAAYPQGFVEWAADWMETANE